MEIGARGLNLIQRWEGLELHAYPDPKSGGDPWTIGYGSTYWLDENGKAVRKVQRGDTITHEEALNQLRLSCNHIYGASVGRIIKAPMTQSMFDAMVSWTYNLGVRRLMIATGTKHMNRQRYEDAIDSYGLWVSPGSNVERGLRRRRAAEKALFLEDGLP